MDRLEVEVASILNVSVSGFFSLCKPGTLYSSLGEGTQFEIEMLLK